MYISGDYYLQCAICGFKKRKSTMKRNWKGQWVCADTCYESRHPLERFRPQKESLPPRHVQPETTDNFLEYGDNTADDL